MADDGGFRPALRALIGVRLREFFREPEAVFWTYFFPILLSVGLGIAFRNQAPEPAQVGWAGWSTADLDLRDALAADSAIRLTDLTDSTAAQMALRTGKVALVVVADSAGVRYRLDETRPEARLARLQAENVIQRARGRTDPVAVGREVVTEHGSRYIDFLIPGLMALNLMGSGVWGTGFSIVDARRRKLLKRLVATPMSRVDYLASFPLAQLGLLVMEIGSILGFGMLAFGVPVHGSFLTLILACVIGALAFGSIGLLAASRPRTIEGASGVMNLVMLPMWVLSGVFFSAARFPEAVQPVIRALPLTALVDALRAVMLEGAGIGVIAHQLVALLIWMAVAFVAALKLFRWQ